MGLINRFFRRNEFCLTCSQYTFWRGCIGGCINPPQTRSEATSGCCGYYRRAGLKLVVLGIVLKTADNAYFSEQLKREEGIHGNPDK